MPLALYMDQHVPRAITVGLRIRGVDAITAFEDGASAFTDAELLDRATALKRVLFTQDDDLLIEAARRQRESVEFHGQSASHTRRL
jgi:predicted nuclease of predicted toxin-antitoxin system